MNSRYATCWARRLLGQHSKRWHTWADADEIEWAKREGEPDPSIEQCPCYCQAAVTR